MRQAVLWLWAMMALGCGRLDFEHVTPDGGTDAAGWDGGSDADASRDTGTVQDTATARDTGTVQDTGTVRDTGDGADSAVVDSGTPSTFSVVATTATSLYELDPVTGDAVWLGDFTCTSATVDDVAVSSSGELFVLAESRLYLVDVSDGSCTDRGAITGSSAPLVALTTGGSTGADLIGATGALPGKHYRIDASTGVATEIGPHGGGYFARGDLDWTASGALLETVTLEEGGDWLARIDPVTGEATIIGPTSSFDGFVDIEGVAYGTSNDGSLSVIDTETGAVLETRETGRAWTGASRRP